MAIECFNCEPGPDDEEARFETIHDWEDVCKRIRNGEGVMIKWPDLDKVEKIFKDRLDAYGKQKTEEA